MDWLLERTVESCPIGVSFGQSSFTYLYFDSFLAEMLKLHVPTHQMMASKATSLGLKLNWQ